MELQIFKNFDFSDFWDDSSYALNEYVEEKPTDEVIESTEIYLGYKLPQSYIELMKLHNGGIPVNTCFPTEEFTSWAEDHIAISGIMGIGKDKPTSLCGEFGSKFWIEEWDYPNIGVYICDCPSAGHDMIVLDYSLCGKNGEPQVMHIDQENNYKKTFLAENFEIFIRGLINEEVYDTSESDLIDTLEMLKKGRFSDIMQEYFRKDNKINFDTILRNLFTEITTEKGYFALHADNLSHLAYDLQFYLLSINKIIKTKEKFMLDYPEMVAFGNNEISTGGYAEGFVEDWFQEKIKLSQISNKDSGGFHFTDDYLNILFDKIKKYQQ